MSKLKDKLVVIDWSDHSTFQTNIWRYEDAFKELSPMKVKTVGWVLKETKKYIILVATRSNNGLVTGEFCIIKGAINKIRIVE